MSRLTRAADYGIVLMTHLAGEDEPPPYSTRDLASEAHLPVPMATKILKQLARKGLLVSHRGMKGGYSLARPASEVSVADIIEALDGPIALTACIEEAPGDCDNEPVCPVRGHVYRINRAIRGALERVPLSELCGPPRDRLVQLESAAEPSPCEAPVACG